MTVEIKFESNLDFQSQAVDSIVDIFDGANIATLNAVDSKLESELRDAADLFSNGVYSNMLNISRDALIENIQRVQSRTRINSLGEEQPIVPEKFRSIIENDQWPSDFSIEMETGTGKTYVYLRTAIELYLKYGLSKFVIVVPSIAIREGVISTLKLTREHFKELFSGVQYDFFIYDSKNTNRLRQFATASHLQFLVMNIASFNRDDNIIKRESDVLNGQAPIDFIHAVRPVVIMDEPQKLGGELNTLAIRKLNSIFNIRYSATHTELHNLMYRLTPVDAYEMRLVKRINVLSMTSEIDRNVPYVEVVSISSSTASVTAVLSVTKGNSVKQLRVKRNSDLHDLTGLQIYEGWVIEDIHVGDDSSVAKVEFANGRVLRKGSSTGVDTDSWQRAQIRATIEDHFETELKLKQKAALGVILQIKPLTLFFIDRVANYAPDDGKFKLWFEEEYEGVALMSKYRNLEMPPAHSAHKGYFAKSKTGAKDSVEGRSNKEDEEAFDLIMSKKEQLLSPEEPVRFIFSHSALAEGWDNPNVFTICNLQETHSEVKRRQQIGRGLRLPVMVSGERCRVEEVNHLTVIATETFEKYAKGLQEEIQKETGLEFAGLIKNKRDRVVLKPKEGFEAMDGFRELWAKIAIRTKYHLDFKTDDLVVEAVRRLKGYERIASPLLNIEKQSIASISTERGISKGSALIKKPRTIGISRKFPDILKQLSSDVPVSRSTIHRVIMESGRLDEAKVNPAEFVSQVHSALFGALAATLMKHDGIKYEKIEDKKNSSWRLDFFKNHFAESYEDNLISVSKSIFERIPVDSLIERRFAEGLDAREDVDLFLKLPSWFKIDTPVGGYNPDWAIVRRDLRNERKIYLVRETKGTANLDELFRESEVWKVTFGRRHFEAINVDYKVVKESKDLDKDELPILEHSVWENALKPSD
ncbi:COG3587 Restriction endonuclease [Candidatus Nanopelagicaceae bacterium]